MQAGRTTLIAGTSERVDVMPHPRLAEALMLARMRRTHEGPADLRMADIPDDLLAWGGIADVLDDQTFRYRHFGRELCRIFGVDMAGRSPRELRPAAYADMIVAQYAETVARRREEHAFAGQVR